MKPLTTQQIKNILNITQQIASSTITDISTDSRKINSSTLFIALKGEKFDGHDFIKDVLSKGALPRKKHN